MVDVSTFSVGLVMPPLENKDPVGIIELNVDLPLVVADPNVKLLVWNDPDSDLHRKGASKLVAFSHYAACLYLYSALDFQMQSQLHVFRYTFMNDFDIQIPRNMTKALSMIGNFSTKSGNFVISHPIVLFHRWMLAGLARDPDLTERAPEYPKNCQDAYKCVWKDIASKSFVDELCLTYIKTHREPFQVLTPYNTYATVTISVPTRENASSWYDFLPREAPFYQELVHVGRLFALSDQDWVHGSYDSKELQTALDIIGCKLNSLTAKILAADFRKAIQNSRSLQDFINNTFLNTPVKVICKGTGAQLVSSTEDEAVWKVPIEDDLANLGFLYNPCANLIYDPQIKSYSRKRREDARLDYASIDFRFKK